MTKRDMIKNCIINFLELPQSMEISLISRENSIFIGYSRTIRARRNLSVHRSR